MPITCVVYGCGNSTRNGNFSWHRFPDAAKHPHLLEMWVSSIKQNSRTMIEFAPNKWSRICSEHFSDHMKETVGNRVVLKLNAVPTIFKNAVNIDYSDEGAKGLLDAASYIETQLNIPVNEVCIGKSIVSEEVEFEKSLVPMPDLVMDDNQINLTQNDCTIEEHDSQVINFNCLLHDHTYSCQSPYRLKRQLEEVIEKAESLKKKLKNSRMQNGRLRMKVNDMSSVVSSLTEIEETNFMVWYIISLFVRNYVVRITIFSISIGRCQKCGLFGHHITECRARMMCRYCKKKGHVKQTCPILARKISSRRRVTNIFKNCQFKGKLM
ncbi:THAP domain-containing protein 1 B-like isoform X2 [Xenia sp. Carnegie-2017]|uniref:THAP domain-containing protein 1 B-like isoform X2 n=1 Tax=Xenia sp. Carnegie-2017 TaxID=2897299 RepID=UPI001F048A9D|nr:THAP domain-containing protein 1 B-like isoform X2 [Xenia sp. Carnegie-2017]